MHHHLCGETLKGWIGGKWAQWLRARASDYRLRGPGFKSCVAVLKPWASFSTLYCSGSLSCINEYLAIDSGGYVYKQPSHINCSIWLDASLRSWDGVWLNTVREVKCESDNPQQLFLPLSATALVSYVSGKCRYYFCPGCSRLWLASFSSEIKKYQSMSSKYVYISIIVVNFLNWN